MKVSFSLLVLAVVYYAVDAKISQPLVKVYSHKPGEFGKDNVFICHVSQFQPPDITIELLKDGVQIPGAETTDLAFAESWQFHLTKSVVFNPQSGEEYSCAVTHQGNRKTFNWESNM